MLAMKRIHREPEGVSRHVHSMVLETDPVVYLESGDVHSLAYLKDSPVEFEKRS
jgi:hypothetical protein